MMKISINRKTIAGPWGGGNNFVKAVYDSAPANVKLSNSLDVDTDLILLMDPRKEGGSFDAQEAFNYSLNKNVKIIQRINECDARKGTEHMDSVLLQCSRINHKTIFVSKWMQDYFNKKGWSCKQQYVVHNGVEDCYFLGKEKESHEPLKIVTHHWSNNYMKGFDAYEFLDYLSTKNDKIVFTYVGRERGTFVNSKIVPPLHGKNLAEELSKHDVYVSASRNDPGPNHILEAIAVGLPTYVHAEGGGAVEFAGQDHTFKNLFELEKLISNFSFKKNSYSPLRWNESMSSFWRIVLS